MIWHPRLAVPIPLVADLGYFKFHVSHLGLMGWNGRR